MNTFTQSIGFIPSVPSLTKEEGIRNAKNHADESWKVRALSVIKVICLTQKEFSADDLRREMEKYPEKTSTLNAVTGILQDAIDAGWCKVATCSCGECPKTVPSRWLKNHGRRIQSYQSLLS